MPVSLFARLGISIAAIIWFLLLVAFLLGLPVLLAWPVWVVAAVVAAGVLVGLVPFALVWILRRRATSYSATGSLLRWVLRGVALSVFLFALPVYYFNFMVEGRPANVPVATLTDGKKTVVFQGMMHVGSENFYKSVVYDLEKALDEGYVLFYEGVSPSPDAKEWFERIMSGGKDLSASYKMLADTCGLKFQLDYFALVQKGVENDPARHIVADVSQADMKAEYERIAAADPGFVARVEAGLDQNKASIGDSFLNNVAAWLENATDDQKAIMGMVCRGFMNMTGKSDSPSAMDPVLLDFRNAKLADKINSWPGDKIYVTYGAAHFPGLVEDLKKLDPAWNVTSIRHTRTIESPERLDP